MEPDLRPTDWHTLRRLALLGGEFVPPYRPVTNGEITGVILRSRARGGPGLLMPGERRRAAWLLQRHGLAASGYRWDSCECRPPQVHLRLGGRAGLHELGLGGLVIGEAGFGGRGLMLAAEPDLEVWSGRFWGAVTGRLSGSLHADGREVPAAFLYSGWPVATNRPAEARARRDEAWRVTAPRAVAGAGLGNWAVAGGIFPVAVGPGLEGGLTMSSHAESLPQLVLRRTAPFQWSGIMAPLDPEHLLLRVGRSSPQTIRYEDPWGLQRISGEPWFFQWLLTWNHTSWWRTTVTHAVLANARRGQTLWPDLIQINAPLLSATWTEVDYGPITDRIFTLGMEARFRDAPWPLLPGAAGRLYWEYGGEDFRPGSVVGTVPQISAPASLAGIELVEHRWDLTVEYLLTRHPKVLWYSNSGFGEGYSHEGVVLGHPLGGGAEAWTAVVRLRTASGAGEFTLRARTVTWDLEGPRPPTARRHELGLSWQRFAGGGAWNMGVGWVREDVAEDREDWLQARLERLF